MILQSLPRLLLVIVSIFIISSCQNEPKSVAEWQHTAIGALDATISRDGRFAMISSVNFGVGFWDLNKNQLLFQWKHDQNPESAIIALNISPDGSRAVTADARTFVIWNTTSGKAYGYWKAPADIRSIALSDKGRYVLLGLGNGLAIHIDMNTGRRLEFTGHRNEAVASVDLSANGRWAFTGGNDYRAVLWNTKTGKPHQLFEHKTRVTKLKLASSGKMAFTSGTKGNATIWNLQTGRPVNQLDLNPREYIISAAAFSHDETMLATGAPGRDVSLWNISTGKKVDQWRARTRQAGKPLGAIIYAVGFSKDDQFVISESSAGFGEKWPINAMP
ncbi:WD40 repeat domain-containing protein [Aliikangiella sp. IMCC44359]|uniref:WD40 repeat domain-containing protein n=1 Tax=Aliikangiella sp. IMCC44359 TaxID=3459125 RepID=UPI00403A9A1F